MFKKIKKISRIFLLSLISSLFFVTAFSPEILADPREETLFDVGLISFGDEEEIDANNRQGSSYFESNYPPLIAFILRIFEIATIIMPTIAVILFIVAGYMFMFSPEQIDTAKDTILYAIIGLVVAFMSYVITIFVQGLFIS